MLAAVVLTALGAGPTAGSSTPSPTPARTESVASIAAGMVADRVYVSPGATAPVSEARRAQLLEDTGRTPNPLYVAVLGPLPPGQSGTKQLASDLYTAVRDATGDEPWIVVYADDTLPAIGGAEPDDEHLEDFVYAIAANEKDRGTVTERLLAFTGRLSGRLDTPRPFDEPPARDGVPTPGAVTAGRIVAIGLVVAVALGLLAAAGWWLTRQGAGRWRSRRLREVVADGTTDDLAIRARRAVLDVGTRIGSTDLAPGDDLAAWQRALDAYDRAGRALDRPGDQDADLRAAVVGCEEAQRALDDVRAGSGRAS